MNYNFRKATITDAPKIWIILQQAILRRKADGSNQWQDGYPNPEIIQQDIEKLQADAELYQRIVNELNHDRSSKDSGREEQILRYQ